MDATPAPEHPPRYWAVTDLIAFIVFFVLSLVILPMAFVAIARIFRPGITVGDLPGEIQILIQAVLDFVWVGFIFFLIKVVHHRPIRESLHWIPTKRYRTGSLIALGATLSIAVSLTSSFFLPSTPLPIEKLVESMRSLTFLAVFGMFFAPILEEIMFRGFFFTVLSDIGDACLAVLVRVVGDNAIVRVLSNIGGAWLAVPCTALLFALLHAPQLWGSWAAIGLILVLGLVLSLARHRSNSLIPSFIIHTSYNSMLFGVSAIGALIERAK